MSHLKMYSCCCWRGRLLLLLVVIACMASAVEARQRRQSEKPNIVIILIDDMGFNDVSFHGSNQFITPNIDALAYNGIILNKHYVPNLCTPSRASLLTGKYPIHTGMQHFVIINDEPWGLPLEEHLMPEIFRDAGYSTNLVGKWHLGFYDKEMTPLYRGFDHHYGYYSGYIGYFDHTLKILQKNISGLDLRNDLEPMPEVNGVYATDLFTQEAVRIIEDHNVERPLFLLMSHLAVHTGNEDSPMDVLEEDLEKYQYIKDPKRRAYAAMVSRLDQSVGQTITALKDKGILNNTIILLYSDNGAPTVGIHSNAGSNYPFKGQKESPWEGGIRSAGLIWSPLLKRKSYVSNQVAHAIDWLPTLASAAGIEIPKHLQLDGVDLWSSLSEAHDPQPRTLIHVLDDVFGYSSYMRGNLKYVNGSSFAGQYDTWLGDIAFEEADPLANFYTQEILSSPVHSALGGNSQLNIELIKRLRTEATNACPVNSENYDQEIYKCEPLKAPCFFNLDKDPCERYNLANLYPLQVQFLAQEVEELKRQTRESARVAFSDPMANPERFGGVWQWWKGTENDDAAGSAGNRLLSWPSRQQLQLLGLSVLLSLLHFIGNYI
ncbi:arylsulfatase B [Musca domestica]|uniref:Arylsulfatase B n=1 Tax=Musca domestica TaxID=7370 RepID=A0A1I8MZW7_MUSDO|nr:arylsulfatase B [Musca domestica]